MLPLSVELLLIVASGVVLVYQGIALVLAREMPRLDPPGPEKGRGPRPTVSVVIAARNEEDELPGTLDALLAQESSNLEIVVVEDGSTDGTRRVIDARAPRVRCVVPLPLPDGWVGKNWACWTGAQATSGEWILFLDADVRLHPDCVGATLAWAERERADLVTLAPRVETVSFWERVVLPFYVQMVLTYFRAPHVNRDTSKTAMANGQYWLTRRSTYFDLGGHQAVASIVLEDVAIARRYRAAGRRLRIAWAPDLAVTRMYRDRKEMFEGLLKNIHGTEYSAARQVGLWSALFGLYLLPLGLLPFAAVEGNLVLVGLGAFLYVALFGKHVGFARGIRSPARYGLLFPLAVGFYLVLLAASLTRGIRGSPVRWKGRNYPVRGP